MHTTQCNDCEKVLYGPQRLRGASQSWWESYLATHANPDTITWEELRGSFRQYHVAAGQMTVKKEEFLALMRETMKKKGYEMLILMLTDVLLEGTQLIYLGGSDDIFEQAFGVEGKDNTLFLPKIMSRKKQVIPMLSDLWT